MNIDIASITPGADFSDTVIGSISWSKGMGKPDRQRLTDGFSIVIIGTQIEDTVSDGPVFYLPFPIVPRVWDGDDEEDNYRIYFSAKGLNSIEGLSAAAFDTSPLKKAEIQIESTYKVLLSLRAGVAWTARLPEALVPVRVEPRELEFTKHDGLLELDAFGLSDSFL